MAMPHSEGRLVQSNVVTLVVHCSNKPVCTKAHNVHIGPRMCRLKDLVSSKHLRWAPSYEWASANQLPKACLCHASTYDDNKGC